ncbi:AEC family transporter [Desulfopila inferna]|uniref:AEC family transporter n=1 Tax=Desulfopila inferna TaxID=468528 RepID=UPI0019645D6B|nr:AEC family transporter [Desulfopila inferna]MBM9603250.1 AEC family transporter [Desulfopila inferna]
MLNIFSEILIIVLPVFIVVVLGYGVKRSSLVDDGFLFQLNRLVYYLALPLLLFFKIASADFSTSFNGRLVLGLALVVFVGFFLSYLFAVYRNYPAETRGTFCQCSFRGNFAYVGLAIVFNAYGEEGLATAGIVLGFIVPLLNFFSIIALLLPHQESRIKPLFFLKQIFLNPLILASFLGIAWSFLEIPIPRVIGSALHIVTGMALPLALISIGASFSVKKLRGDLSVAFVATAFKLVLMPLAAAFLLHALGVHGRDLVMGVIFAGTPTATAAYIFSQQMRGDAELAGSLIMLTTLLSAVTYTAALLILKSVGV